MFLLLVTFREVWPDGDVFGSADVEPEEELELLKQILHANLPSKLRFLLETLELYDHQQFTIYY